MVAYHKPKNLQELVIPNRMKVYIEIYLRSSTYVKNQTGNVLGVAVKDRVKHIALDDGVSSGTRESK